MDVVEPLLNRLKTLSCCISELVDLLFKSVRTQACSLKSFRGNAGQLSYLFFETFKIRHTPNIVPYPGCVKARTRPCHINSGYVKLIGNGVCRGVTLHTGGLGGPFDGLYSTPADWSLFGRSVRGRQLYRRLPHAPRV